MEPPNHVYRFFKFENYLFNHYGKQIFLSMSPYIKDLPQINLLTNHAISYRVPSLNLKSAFKGFQNMQGFRPFKKESTSFTGLNYTLTNEDNLIEGMTLPDNQENVLAICGSGSYVVPLLAKYPKTLHLVDMSREQVLFSDLRLTSIRDLEYDEYLLFWSLPPHDTQSNCKLRKKMFKKLSFQLEHTALFSKNLFEQNNWQGLLYTGKWEKRFKKHSKLVRFLLNQTLMSKIFECENIKIQRQLFQRLSNTLGYKSFLFISFFVTQMAYLLAPHSMPCYNNDSSLFQIQKNFFHSLFNEHLAQNNYFLQMLYYGKIKNLSAAPLEFQPQTFLKAKESLQNYTKIIYHTGDALKVITQIKEDLNYIALSNIVPYFSQENRKHFLRKILNKIAPHGRIITRHYLYDPIKEVVIPPNLKRDPLLAKQIKKYDTFPLYHIEIYHRPGH